MLRHMFVTACTLAAVATATAGDCLTLSLAGEATDISTAATTQRLAPALAWNSQDNQYFVVWFDTRNPGENDVFGQRLDADGQPIGGNVPIIEFSDAQIDPGIAYNSTNNQFLVAWRTQHGGAFNQGYGRLFQADGTPVGGQFFVSNGGFECSLAYNPVRNEYFHQGRNFAGGGAAGIRGQRVAANGGLVGQNITIASAGAPAPNGQAAYDSVNNRYLCTWRDQVASNLQGQLVTAVGAVSGPPILISSTFPGSSRAASQAFDPLNERYLVVFGEFQSNNVRAQLIGADGQPQGGNFFVATGLSAPANPFVVYADAAEAFVVLWRDGSSIFAQVVDNDGTVVGDPLPVTTDTANGDPQAVYGSWTTEVLVAWSDNRNLGFGEQDIFVQRLAFACCDPCDANCDAAVDAFDIEPFIDVLFNGATPCSACACDTDGDGDRDAFDIEPFIACLFGP